jgi:hypothetical protein
MHLAARSIYSHAARIFGCALMCDDTAAGQIRLVSALGLLYDHANPTGKVSQ